MNECPLREYLLKSRQGERERGKEGVKFIDFFWNEVENSSKGIG